MSKRLGAGVSSAHSLASDTSEGTRRRVTRKGGKETAISPAGSNARSSRGMVQANVGQKRLKRHILRRFFLSDIR